MKDTNRLPDIQIKINGIAQTLYGLALQFNGECDTLPPEHMKDALIGTARHLERIYSDLVEFEKEIQE